MPHILCTGIAVLDEVFRVKEFPIADAKVEAAYTVAYIAHAPLEPRAAVAEWSASPWFTTG